MTRPSPPQELDLEPHPEGGWFHQTWRSPASAFDDFELEP
jgi:predicted cupin superfamily sugar epimerase